ATGRITYGSGAAQVKIADPTVTYCANPGRSNGQAIVSGTVTTGKGRLRKGDQMTLTLSMIGAARLPDAVLVDGATKQRIAIIGPYDVGSAIRIATP
ncbi:MAG: hypothetical protein ACRDIE_19665, partial [Chloroflexota bacterium]